MFTFKPASKNGSNGNGQSSGHSNGNGNGNGHSEGNSSGNHNGNGNGHGNSQGRSPVSAWLGLGNGAKNGNVNGHSNGNGHSNKIESVLGPGIHFQGTFTGAGGIRIEGTFDGSINVRGAVVVADGAKVTANIQAASVSIAGTVQGDITADKVEIRSTGRIFGDLVTTKFATEEGAFLRGQVRMEDELTDPEPAQLPAPAAALPETAPMLESIASGTAAPTAA